MKIGMCRIVLLFLLCFCSSNVFGQYFPADGSKLHYRLIGFTFPATDKSDTYVLEIAQGHFTNADSFSKNVINKLPTEKNRIIAEVPLFGSDYTWRVTYNVHGKGVRTSEMNHFYTIKNDRVDSSKQRLRIMKPAQKHNDNYVITDGGGVIYDMNGQPVWFIPETKEFSGNVADVKVTKENTLTFICGDDFEIDYNANKLWKSPKVGKITGDTAHGELYHHEFYKMANGHYLALGLHNKLSKIVKNNGVPSLETIDSKVIEAHDGYKIGKYGFLVEYDKDNNIVWTWKSLDYYKTSDLPYFNPADSMLIFDAHDNSFYFDEQAKVIYLGYKNISRVVKIEYPSGKVLATYGENFKPGEIGTGSGLFCQQHAINILSNGDFCFYNNNSCNRSDSLPTVEIVREPDGSHKDFKKVWEYTCIGDGKKNFYVRGGNVIELKDKSLFVNMGGRYSKLFIIDRAKNIDWEALPEKYMFTELRWSPVYEYRTNIISRKVLEQLIWKAQGY